MQNKIESGRYLFNFVKNNRTAHTFYNLKNTPFFNTIKKKKIASEETIFLGTNINKKYYIWESKLHILCIKKQWTSLQFYSLKSG